MKKVRGWYCTVCHIVFADPDPHVPYPHYNGGPDPNLHYSEKLDYGSTSKSKFRGCRGANGAMKGCGRSQRRLVSAKWRRVSDKWSRGGSLDQWSQIRITP
jgi:hypothetical protein